MVVGNGLIASKFIKYDKDEVILIFASGVSNSLEKSEKEFLREEKLLKKCIEDNINKKFIYFSSCGIEDKDLNEIPYYIHKRRMEKYIQEVSNNYIIFRLSNVIGRDGSSGTIINFILDKIKGEKYFELWKNATRNIIDIEDIYNIVSYILEKNIMKNQIINIAYKKNIKVLDIVNAIENLTLIKSNYKIIDKGNDLKINIKKIEFLFELLNIKQISIEKLIRKYKII